MQTVEATNDLDKPLISIGVTCFNAGETVCRAIDAAVGQQWPNLEIIVVDDYSLDNSVDLIESYLMGLDEDLRDKVKFICHKENKGYPGALNTIIAAAAGEFVAFFDDDDFSRPDRLTKQFQRIVSYERTTGASLVLCYSNRDVIKTGCSSVDHVAYAIGRTEPEPSGDAVAEYIFGYGVDNTFTWGMFGSCTLMARISTFEHVGAFDTQFRRCAEWDMAIRLSMMGGHFIAVNDSLITQYKTASEDKAGNKPLQYSLLLREKYKKYLKSNRVYRASRMVAFSRFYGAKRKCWVSRMYRIAYILSLPRKILFKKLEKKFKTVS